MDGKLTRKKGSWFEWEQWQKRESIGSRNLRPKLSVMEDANGGLSVPKGSIPSIGRKRKTISGYEG